MTFIQVWDAGHGYNTPGKRTPDGMKEYEFNRTVANYCKQFTDAEFEGVQSVFTHSDSRDVPLGERTAHANRIKADCFTSIHANAFGAGGWHSASGIETFVYTTRPTKAYALALQVQRDLIAATGLTDRGVKTANFQVLRETKMTAILAECGFMTNQKDAALLKSDAYRKKVARALVDGHAAFFGWKKKVVKPVVKPAAAKAPAKGTFYRVVTGSFGDRANAEKRLAELKKAGFDSFIDVFQK